MLGSFSDPTHNKNQFLLWNIKQRGVCTGARITGKMSVVYADAPLKTPHITAVIFTLLSCCLHYPDDLTSTSSRTAGKMSVMYADAPLNTPHITLT